MRIVFIINPNSGTFTINEWLKFMIGKKFSRKDSRISIYTSSNIEQAQKIAKKAVDERVELVVAVGGDGTINNIAQVLIHSETALGVLPSGSGNGFARNLGIPLNLEQALSHIKDPKIRQIDVGKIKEHIFLVSCGIGWEAVIATEFEKSKIRGFVSYANTTITSYLQYKPQKITLTTQPDRWKYTGTPLFFSVANMREFGAGVTIAPNAKEDDGLLDIVLIPKQNFINAVKHSNKMFLKKTDLIPGFISHQVTSLTISRLYASNIHLDGTPLFVAQNEFDIEVLPGALKVAVRHKNH